MSHSKIIHGWWSQRIGARDSPAARALAARLARGGPIACLAQSAVYDLGKDLNLLRQPEKLLPLVRVLAAVREHRSEPLPRRLGETLSPLRFERLIRAEGEELADLIRRALPMVDRACDVGRLGADLLAWDDAVRVRWAIDYHGGRQPHSAAAEPDTSAPDEETTA
ncbi:type I-E CRISPR-associated protein Cse2/CasB [Paracoccus spongiarum]|uniref:Type I-E CRISPR-associated protein Cse2/CasB n=1 Tax=Paracoccus spongiarum TaxID=3064387 RepID=A0ABT9J9V5_9RHOB|nr:type I-E CRISPR-associated protein Cse2/CasB [Paracoccus sp. 2205BS29-5]MDP5306424.1 type I-E CRISPR-associated protein Cse2/CasB [Paracoccus sp. 2205BS29-5]